MKCNKLLLLIIIACAAFQALAQSDTTFVNMQLHTERFVWDMRYATENNFLKEKVYPCDNCLLRAEVAKALVKASDILARQGYKIKFFDCFRPVDVQKKMWAIKPDSRYVANPYKSGSIHNRGAAVDITLVDQQGREVDMGTGFDHFGEEAHHSFTKLPKQVLENRQRLRSAMEQCGFVAQSTEWWHYNYGERSRYKISNEKLCP